MIAFLLIGVTLIQGAQSNMENDWLKNFTQKSIPARSSGICKGAIGENLPKFQVIPPTPGKHLIRVSLPFPPGAIPENSTPIVKTADKTIIPGFRPLTYHPGYPRTIRRGILTFPHHFSTTQPISFELELSYENKFESPFDWSPPSESDPSLKTCFSNIHVILSKDQLELTYPDNTTWAIQFIAPPISSAIPPTAELIEKNEHYFWFRFLIPDTTWPRIVEIRIDSFGRAAIQLHIQRQEEDNPFAPELGLKIYTPQLEEKVKHSFTTGEPFMIHTHDRHYILDFPQAPYLRRGWISSENTPDNGIVTYIRCTPEEKVPFQSKAWRNAACTIIPSSNSLLTPLFEPDINIVIPADSFAKTYNLDTFSPALYADFQELIQFTHEAIKQSVCFGDDYGSISSYTKGQPASYLSMNRLNHAPAIFNDAWLLQKPELRNIAILWCNNMYDLSLWWGLDESFGGTRYNNLAARGESTPETNPSFMWRSNDAVSFCTKGFVSFLYAYEETGDPRMSVALNAQTEYAMRKIHANQGECRNIGVVDDFISLFLLTGEEIYKNEALRLFRELKSHLSENYLFDQGGKPIENELPFIDDDSIGLKHGYVKPYIVGYALQGLPTLWEICPNEPDLGEVVSAVATFLANNQDPLGGWRYPHPRSSTLLIAQSIEHAEQLVRAAKILMKQNQNISPLLNAIEKTLQTRVKTFEKTGDLIYGVEGWEKQPGALPENQTIYDLYKSPEDRSGERDYKDGKIITNTSPPEGLVYLTNILNFYLKQRPSERLFHANQPLQTILDRLENKRINFNVDKNILIATVPVSNTPVTLTITPKLPVSDGTDTATPNITWEYNPNDLTASYEYTTSSFTLLTSFTSHVNSLKGQINVIPQEFSSDGTIEPFTLVINTTEEIDHSPIPHHDSTNDFTASQFLSNKANLLVLAENCIIKNENNEITLTFNLPIPKYTIHAVRFKILVMDKTQDTVEDEIRLTKLLWQNTPATPSRTVLRSLKFGMYQRLPVFTDCHLHTMSFPLSWENSTQPFAIWRQTARAKLLESLGPALPHGSFEMAIIGVENRGEYNAYKILFNISAYERIKGYLLVPSTYASIYPAIIALHDHGAHFSIGKEKVIRPFDEPPETLEDAQNWVNKYYGGRWIGDELATRGYVVFATDALFWSDRGRQEGVDYHAQQGPAANMFQLGLSWAGKIVWDDIRSAQFVQSLPFVDPDKIGCIGLSLGAHRTWHLAAATDIIKAGAAICWMDDTPTLMTEGNNQTKGQSSFSMIHPWLRNYLDYPDVACIACPKPMLFFNGSQDPLFPIEGVKRCFEKMKKVWEDAGVPEKLHTKIWDVPHEFTLPMQEEAFAWLIQWLK